MNLDFAQRKKKMPAQEFSNPESPVPSRRLSLMFAVFLNTDQFYESRGLD